MSSRLGRELDLRQAWFSVLRAACGKVDREQSVIVTAKGSTTWRFVGRCSHLFETPILRIHLPTEKESPVDWLRRIARQNERPIGPACKDLFLSPAFAATTQEDDEALTKTIPDQDRALAAISDELLVLHVRAKGAVDQVVRQRLADDAWQDASVYVALGPGLTERRLADELMKNGAVGWLVNEVHGDDQSLRLPPKSQSSTIIAPVVPMPVAETWDFLTHFTRHRDGPWPDQDERQFLDALILGHADADHSAIASLDRMLNQRRIAASNNTIRGGFRVVSFTAVPLPKISRRRVFRIHRGRWDFEPYGLCLRRDWLTARKTKSVEYGDDELWNRMSPSEQPFFQIASTRRDDPQKKSIDWSEEREWRHLGDVDIDELPADAGLVFVPTLAEAELVANISRWPIVVIGE